MATAELRSIYSGPVRRGFNRLDAKIAELEASIGTITQLPYRWSTQTTMADPGGGLVRANNASPGLATQLAVSLYDINGAGHPGLLQGQVDDEIAIYHGDDFGRSIKYTIAAAISNNANLWALIPVTYVSQNGTFGPTNNQDIQLAVRTGAGGAGTTAPGDWVPCPFVAGWANVANYTPAAFRLETPNIVQWRGAAQRTGASFTTTATLCTIPTGYRPISAEQFAGVTNATATGGPGYVTARLALNQTGDFQVQIGSSQTFAQNWSVSLGNVRYALT